MFVGCADQGAQAPDDPAVSQAAHPITAAIQLGAVPLSRDAHGLPNLLRGGDTAPKFPAATATESALQHLERLSPSWGLRGADKMPNLEALGEVPVLGGTIVRFRQVIDGLPVEPTAGGEMRVMVRPDGGLVGVSGKLVANDTARAAVNKFVDDDAGAIARAVNDKYKTTKVTSRMLAHGRTAVDGSRLLSGSEAGVTVSMSRARQAWFPTASGLIASWVVEAYSSASTSAKAEAYRTVISSTGKVLSRTNLEADAGGTFKYRVYAETTGELHPMDGPLMNVDALSPFDPIASPFKPFPNTPPPPALNPTANLVSVLGTNHGPGGAPDAWLDASATDTLAGNNVHAYTDAHPPDGLTVTTDPATSDFPANLKPDGTFDRQYDVTKGPFASTDQTKAGITSLFYMINWMHDFWYDGGFVEAAGNGQDNNYGRGGVDHDAVLAEAQDNALDPMAPSRDNANMFTPADGMPGKMQVFVWDNTDGRTLSVNAVPFQTNTAAFGKTTFDATGVVILANDGSTGTDGKGSVSDGCQPLVGTYTNKIVVVDRGSCTFQTKAFNAQTAGAAGVIIANNAPGGAPGLAGDATVGAITIGTLSVSQADGVLIKAAIDGTKTATMHRDLGADEDGALDITVVGHEYGHFVHHRLTECNTSLCGAMSEGWADFSALLVSSRAGDDFAHGAFPLAIYSTRGISLESQYYGIRRAPYTVNHAINALSFRHMAAGEALPPAPFNGGDPMVNSEVHNGGEVWASMLWEGYVALQTQPGADFAATRLKMRQYVVAGLLMAPPDATPTETRDAVLTAVRAASPADYDLLAHAYAQRGFGSCAESPDRNSVDFNPIVESADIKGRTDIGELGVSGSQACDNDNVLDPGEQFQIVVPISNGGAAKLTGVTATLHSQLVKFDDPAKATVAVGDLDLNGKGSATFTVTLADTVTKPTESDITIDIASSDGCKTVTVPLTARFDSDDKPNSSASDDFNAGAIAWTASADKEWSQVRFSGLDGAILGNAAEVPTDTTLVSPTITAGSAPVTLTFQAAWEFESHPDTNGINAVDGGVIEYTTDNGATWNDLSQIADLTALYNVQLLDKTGNALENRPAVGDVNANFPQPDNVSIDLGTKLANQSFQIRFRIGTDEGTGGAGWLIDNLAFTGITNTPFTTLVADGGHCDGVPGTNNPDDGGCCQTGRGMSTGSVLAAIGALGLVLRRRRRAAR
ncbi:MAG TPA: M36 family metallopeptidase [Kofleriaceae bacterium]|nr:M36 family metallopeptidase [Kofleriaceae bacterium]